MKQLEYKIFEATWRSIIKKYFYTYGSSFKCRSHYINRAVLLCGRWLISQKKKKNADYSWTQETYTLGRLFLASLLKFWRYLLPRAVEAKKRSISRAPKALVEINRTKLFPSPIARSPRPNFIDITYIIDILN